MSASAPKYKAKPVYWDSETRVVTSSSFVSSFKRKGKLKLPKHIWRFDSQHEFRVYIELIRMYGAERILRQYPIEVLPPSLCYPKGKKWRADFVVVSLRSGILVESVVEAKGLFLPEFASILACLESSDKKLFDRTVIVFPSSIPTNVTMVKSLSLIDDSIRLCTLRHLKKLHKL